MPDIEVEMHFAFLKKWVAELTFRALITACWHGLLFQYISLGSTLSKGVLC